MCAADPERDRLQIRENVARGCSRRKIRSWNHEWRLVVWREALPAVIPSNTQFAMLALYEAERVGVEVQDVTWRAALGYWTRQQRE